MINDITLEHVTLKNAEGQTILKDISCKVKKGEVLGIFGPSGSGKTTLLFLICGLTNPSEGSVLINGNNPSKDKGLWKKTRKDFAVSVQFPEDMFFQESVFGEFKKLYEGDGYSPELIRALAYDSLKWAGLDISGILERHPLKLSQGELRRLSLAIVWGKKKECIILDEPTAGVEAISKERLLCGIIGYCHENKKIGIMLSHDIRELLPLVDRIMIINKGKMVCHGGWAEVLENPDLLTSAGLCLPTFAELSIKLREAGIPVKNIWRQLDQAKEEILQLLSNRGGTPLSTVESARK